MYIFGVVKRSEKGPFYNVMIIMQRLQNVNFFVHYRNNVLQWGHDDQNLQQGLFSSWLLLFYT